MSERVVLYRFFDGHTLGQRFGPFTFNLLALGIAFVQDKAAKAKEEDGRVFRAIERLEWLVVTKVRLEQRARTPIRFVNGFGVGLVGRAKPHLHSVATRCGGKCQIQKRGVRDHRRLKSCNKQAIRIAAFTFIECLL